ncbi:hypothetical protein VTN02DRAFT_1954 [Thermoascus thermophilus]
MATDKYAFQVLQLARLVGDTGPVDEALYPVEADALFTLAHIYDEGPGSALNCARPLEHNLVIRVVVRNASATAPDRTSGDQVKAAGVTLEEALPVYFSLPSPADLFSLVWGLVPRFIKDKIHDLAKNGKDQQIARAITEYVKMALSALPLPVPTIFLNAAANLVIPPLVAYIIEKFAGGGGTVKAGANFHRLTQTPRGFGISYAHTPSTLKVLKGFDRRILLAAGLRAADLPIHLKAAERDDGTEYPCIGQPDDRDASADLKQFYELDTRNGCKPLALAQIVAAQIRTNPASDEDPTTFGKVVWGTLDQSEKVQIKNWVSQSPPARAEMARFLYRPVCNILGRSPYSVPEPIQPTFTSMKVPEVVEYFINPFD